VSSNTALKEAIKKTCRTRIGQDTYTRGWAVLIRLTMQRERINVTKKNTKTVLNGCTKLGLEINVSQTKNMFMSHRQNGGQKRNTKTANKYFENSRNV
jgi:hypothetical protein